MSDSQQHPAWMGKNSRMSADEVKEFLAGPVVARIATIDEEGLPYITPAWQEWDGEADSSIVTSVRGAGDEHAVAYGWMPDENEEKEPAEAGAGEQDGAGGEFDEPFVEF